MTRVRGCVLVAAYASHPVLLSVTVYYKSPHSKSLKQSQSQGRTMIPSRNQTQTLTEKSWTVTWQDAEPIIKRGLKGREWARSHETKWKMKHTASPVSSLDPSSPSPSLFASPLLPRSDLQSHSYQQPNTLQYHASNGATRSEKDYELGLKLLGHVNGRGSVSL